MSRAVLSIACLLLLATGTAFADDTLWARRYNGQGNRNDNARVVLVDQSDNVIVVGSCIGVGTGNDITVVMYNSAGAQQWFATIAGAGASNDDPKGAALDGSGNVYVTGTTGTYPNYNILTAKLSPTGSEAWRWTYEGPDGKADEPAAITLDSTGNPIVTGYTTHTNGLTDWVTMKHMRTNGLPMWTVVREGGGSDYPTALKLGPGNTVYVTGYGQSLNEDDYITVKYSAAGVAQWTNTYNHSGNAGDRAAAIAVDAAGNAYVTGTSATAPAPSGKDQYATIKYANDSGAQMWVTRYTGIGGHNSAVAIALGASNVYVTGKSQNSAGNNDYATLAYDVGAGGQQWETRFDGPPGKDDEAVAMALRSDGMILVTGTSVDWNDKGDFMTLRYTTAGVEEWAARYNSEFDNAEAAKSIAIDSRSNPVVLGNSYGSANYDFLTVKYDSAGFGGITESGPAAPVRPALRLAPNPANDWTRVEYSTVGNAPATISLLGVDGRAVRTLQASGTTRLDLAGLTPGVYIVRLVSGGRAATQKLVIGQ